TQKDAQGSPVLDANGRYQKDRLTGIFVQRKEPGFGEAYQDARAGEWEWVAYHPDRTYLTLPQNSANCAACHLQQARAPRDFVFRADLFFAKNSGALPKGIIQSYSFVPDT